MGTTTKPARLGERITVRMPSDMLDDLGDEVTERGYSDKPELVRAIIRAHQDARRAARG
jgi:Arc/MetJ-type ribon-helix-helix transcriptional regulator